MSSPRMDTCIPLPLKQQVLTDIVHKAKDWALMHGAAMRSKVNFSQDSLQFAPFILLPSTFPRAEFVKAIKLQVILNELVHYVAHDHEFLSDSLKCTIEVDQFTANLYKIYESVRKEGFTQCLSLGLVRSDIMLESSCPCEPNYPGCQPYCCWKQVEVNTIASGFGWLGPISANIHRYVLQELGHEELLKNLPENTALEGLCGGMVEAWKLYGDKNAAILFIIEDVSYNICDQRFHEFEIRRSYPHIQVFRKTLTEVGQFAKLGPRKELMIDGQVFSVVYFRAGYEPNHYPSQLEWDARLLIERSLAIKCPSIHYHLAGTKKVQQALARAGVLQRFLKDTKKVDAVKEIFTGLYSLDFDEYGEAAMEMAIKNPERFVLKPQREGGGNNVYGKEIADTLVAMKKSKERTAWILMDRITPPIQTSYMVRPGLEGAVPALSDLVSELGIFGVVIGDAENIMVNQQVGHMLRTKLDTSNEGGVAAGSGALDSPYLVD